MEWKIPYGKQEITQGDIDAVIRALTSEFLTQGPIGVEFENNFAEFLGAKYALTCANGTAALHLAMMALDVKEGQKILSTPLTFAATTNSILYQKAEVEFVDVSLDNYLIDLELLEKFLSETLNTYAGIVVVDLAGHPVQADQLRKIADKYGMWIIEDACHAPGATFVDENKDVNFTGNGKYSDLTVFSFHPVKHIACGEGGMITTNSSDLYDKLQLYRTHGIIKDRSKFTNGRGKASWYHEMIELGYNYRLSDIQSALGISQLKKLPQSLLKRRKIAKRYTEELSSTPLILPKVTEGIEHAYHLYVVRTDKREELFNYLQENGIFAQVHYIPVYLHPYYEKLGFKEGICPNAEIYYSECLSLPMFPSITEEELGYTIDTIKKFFEKP